MPSKSQHKAKSRAHESFASYVARTRAQAVNHITDQAREASHIAKITTDASRRQLYARKARLISWAFELDPNAFVVDSFNMRVRQFGLERSANSVRLHAPADQLSPIARDAVLAQMHAILAGPSTAA